MNNINPKYSIIIPTKNEEKNIERCIDSILKQNLIKTIEIIVIDNASTDNTISILDEYKRSGSLSFYVKKDINISQLRNFGAKNSRGEWLIFIDADVEVHREWLENIEIVINEFARKNSDNYKIITGSTYDIPEQSTWIEKRWFKQLQSRNIKTSRYINAGNMVITRRLFEEIGGFDPLCYTGEDVKLCEDAIKMGAIVINDARIKTYHHGYPKTIKGFFKRERWHGLGMKRNFITPWKSRDLTFAIYNIMVLFSTIIIGVFVNIYKGWLILIVICGLLFPVITFAWVRGGKTPKEIVQLSLLYLIYGFARACSIYDIISKNYQTRKK